MTSGCGAESLAPDSRPGWSRPPLEAACPLARPPASRAPAERRLGAEQLVHAPGLIRAPGDLQAAGVLEPAPEPVEPGQRPLQRKLVPGDPTSAVELRDQARQLVEALHRIE